MLKVKMAKLVRRPFLDALSKTMRQGLGRKVGVGLASLALGSSLYSPIAMGQVITDPRAPIQFRPKIGTSANGTPVIDITKPSFGGISHNKFQRYDVDTRGIILNNSKLTGTSLIGGQVVANPNLAGQRPARVILNEVTSSAASTLNGPTEVFGARADVIVANPNGVACNGCSFVNSGRVTLSTGTPLPDYRRGTVKFDVSRGTVSVNGGGLLGMNEILGRVDLIGRQLKINGPIQTQDVVRLRAGGMVYDQRGDIATAKPVSELSAIDGPAIQSNSAGKITAGTLSVLSRDLDVGVQLTGALTAHTESLSIKSFGDATIGPAVAMGDIQLTATGQIRLTGHSQALGRIVASGRRIEVALDKELVANDTIVFEALQSLATRGVLKAGNAISLVSGGQLVAEGIIASNGEIAFEGKSFASKGLTISGRSVSVAGLDSAILENTEIVATGDSIKVAGVAVELGAGTVFQARDRIVVDAKGTLTNGTSLNYANLDLSVRNSLNNTVRGELVLDHVLLIVRDKIENAGLIYGRRDTRIDAEALTNATTGIIYGPEVTVTVRQDLTNLGQILSDRTLSLIASDIVNKGTLKAGTSLTLKGTSYRANSTEAVLAAATADLIVSGEIENAGQVVGTDRLSVIAAGSVANSGTFVSDKALSLTATHYRATSSAQLGGKSVVIRLSSDLENAGFIAGTDLVDVEAANLSNGPTITDSQAGQILGQTITLTALSGIANAGTIGASDTLRISSGGLTNSGSLIANTDATLALAGHVANTGTIGSAASLILEAGSYTSASTAIVSSKVVTVDLQSGALDNAGKIYGSTSITLTSGALVNRGSPSAIGGATATLTTHGSLRNEGQIAADDVLKLTVHGGLTNAGNILTGAGNLTLTADGAISSTGTLAATGALTITAASLSNAATTAQMGGSSMVVRLSGDFDNRGLVSGGASLNISSRRFFNGPAGSEKAGLVLGDIFVLTAQSDVTNQGTLQSDTSLTVKGGAGILNTGMIGSNETLLIDVANAIDNRKGMAATFLTLKGASYSGAAASSLNGFDIAIALPGDFTNSGRIDARSLLTLTARDVSNSAGGVIGADSILLTANADLVNAGTIASRTLGSLNVKGELTNSGKITSAKDLSIKIGGALDNSKLIQATEVLIIGKVGAVTNRSGARIQGEFVSLTSTDKVTNAGIIDGSEGIFIKADSLSNHGVSASNYASISSKKVTVEVSGALILGTNSLLQGKTDATIKAKTISSGFFRNDTIAEGRFVFGKNLDFTLTQGGWTFAEDFKVKGDLSFKVAGDITNLATLAAGGSLTLISTGGSITNGVNDPAAPGGGLIYSNGDMTLKAGGDIRNYASVIQSGGNLVLDADGTILNTRTDTTTETSYSTIPGGTPADVVIVKMVETSGPASIDAMGDITMTAGTVKNIASSVIAGNNLTITAGNILNDVRVLTQTETHYRKGEVFGPWVTVIGETPALFVAGNVFDYSGNIAGNGTIQAYTVVGHGGTVTIGGTSAIAPPRIPDASIDLADAIDLVGQGLVPGSGPAYIPDPKADTGAVTGTRPGDTEVKVGGRVSFLYATPVPSGGKDRNPSWIFAQVGANAANMTFFADPATERRLIQQALIEQTGRAILDPKYRNPKEQQEALYEGTVDFLKANPEVKLGSKLTAAQRAKVTKPILWYEYQTVNGQQVLVPQLILPEKDLAKYASITGGAILADNISITADKVTNTGTILAVNNLTIDAKEFLNERRVASAGGLSPFALQAGGMISAKTMTITTTGDLINRGGALVAGERLVLKAGGHIRIEAQTITNSSYTGNKKNWSVTTDITHVGGLVSSGGYLQMSADKTLNILGSTVTAAGDAVLEGKRGVTIASVIDQHEVMAGGKKNNLLTRSSYGYSERIFTNLSSLVSAGGSMTVRSETGDITIAASHLVANKDLAVLAGYDAHGNKLKGSQASVHILSGQDVMDRALSQKKSGFGFFATGGGVDFYRSTKSALTTSEAHNVASSLTAGGNLVVKARRDIDIMGSVINAQGTATLDAGRDITVGTGQDASGSDYSKKVKGYGIQFSGGDGGFSVRQGYHASSQYASYDRVSVAPSIIYGGKGVNMKAGRDITLVAATVTSPGLVDLDAGRDLKLLAGANRETSYQSSKEVFAGITLKVGQNVTGALQQLQQSPATFSSGYGGGAYKAIGMVSGAMQAIDAMLQLSSPAVSARLTIGANGSKSTSWTESVNAVPTVINAGTFKATSGRDMHFVGAQIDVTKDATLTVGRDFVAESAKSYGSSGSSSSNWNAGVGGYLGTTGMGLTAEGGFGRSKDGSWTETNLNTHLNVGGTLTMTVEKDATLKGAVVKADTIDATIKGNLSIASVQDKGHTAHEAVNASATVNIGLVGPSSVSVSGGGSRGTSDTAWVNEQSGFFGKNKVDIYVEKHTQLDGAVIASEAGKDRVTLDTGTLGFSDLKDHDKRTSLGVQVGVTLSQPGKDGQKPKTDAQGNLVGGSLSGSYAMHDVEQVTRATVEGTVKIRDKGNQQQDVAALNRDADKAQVIVKDVRAGTKVYVSDTAIKEVVSGFKTIRENVERLAMGSFVEMPDLPDDVRLVLESGDVGALDLAFAVKALFSGEKNLDDPEITGELRRAALKCSGNTMCSGRAKEILAQFESEFAARPDMVQYTSSAGGIKKMGDGPLLAAAKANGYSDIHAMKRDLGLDSKSNIGIDRNGNLYQLGVKAIFVPIPLGLTASGK